MTAPDEVLARLPKKYKAIAMDVGGEWHAYAKRLPTFYRGFWLPDSDANSKRLGPLAADYDGPPSESLYVRPPVEKAAPTKRYYAIYWLAERGLSKGMYADVKAWCQPVVFLSKAERDDWVATPLMRSTVYGYRESVSVRKLPFGWGVKSFIAVARLP